MALSLEAVSSLDVGFPSVCYEHVLSLLVNKEDTLANGRAEYR